MAYKNYVVNSKEEIIREYGFVKPGSQRIRTGTGSYVMACWQGLFGKKFRHDFKKKPTHKLSVPGLDPVIIHRKMCRPVGVSEKEEREKSRIGNFYVSKQLREKIDEYLDVNNLIMSDLMEDALNKFFKKGNKS